MRRDAAPLPPFDRFFGEHRYAVYRYLRARLDSVADVEDCFQETFLSALDAYDRLHVDSNLRAWVLTIAERKAIDAVRRRGRAEARAEVPDPGTASHDGSDPDLWAAVAELPPKQRSAIAHRYMGDLPHSEIARVMGISEEASRQNVREGLRKLRKVVSR